MEREQDRLYNEMIKFVMSDKLPEFKKLLVEYGLVMMKIGKKDNEKL